MQDLIKLRNFMFFMRSHTRLAMLLLVASEGLLQVSIQIDSSLLNCACKYLIQYEPESYRLG